jgi:hypothetical protein
VSNRRTISSYRAPPRILAGSKMIDPELEEEMLGVV